MKKLLLSSICALILGACTASAQTTLTLSGGQLASPLALTCTSISGDFLQNIALSSTSTGAGKVAFNPLTITRAANSASSTLFTMECAGTFAKRGVLKVGTMTLNMGQVYVKEMEYSVDSAGNLVEKVSFVFGGFSISDGTAGNEKGWSLLSNTSWTTAGTNP